jgi:Sec-independent protein translocase protein TatA
MYGKSKTSMARAISIFKKEERRRRNEENEQKQQQQQSDHLEGVRR